MLENYFKAVKISVNWGTIWKQTSFEWTFFSLYGGGNFGIVRCLKVKKIVVKAKLIDKILLSSIKL